MSTLPPNQTTPIQPVPAIARYDLAGHQTLELQTTTAYRPYDHLVLREATGRTIWTVLNCEQTTEGWTVTAIRCRPNCSIHHRKR